MVSDAGAIRRSDVDAPFCDPFARVLALDAPGGRRLAASLVVTLALHAAGAARGFALATGLHAFAADVHRLLTPKEYDVQIEPPPPEPPPPEPPPPEPEAAPTQPKDAPAAPPPAPAQAGKVLTADPDPDEPVDLTGGGFVQGDGDSYAGGVTSSTGTNRSAVYGVHPAGSAQGPAAPERPAVAAAPKQDLSRQAKPVSDLWDCGFPAEADIEQIDNARVSVTVTVGADGRAQRVTVMHDPGYGFGALAKRCALRKEYQPALARDGTPILQTQIVNINFVRR